MNARSRRFIGVVALALAAGCGGQEAGEPGAAVETAVRSEADPAIEVALAIRANPGAADSILAAHGLTSDGFDSLMYDVAADAERARAYTEAMR